MRGLEPASSCARAGGGDPGCCRSRGPRRAPWRCRLRLPRGWSARWRRAAPRGRAAQPPAPTPPKKTPWRGTFHRGPGAAGTRSPTGPVPPRSHPRINCVSIRGMAKSKRIPGDPIPDLVETLLAELGEDPHRQGLRATPERVSRALRQLTDGYGVKPEDVIADAVFDQDYDEMVVVKDILFYSLCEHHMLPFFCTCHVGYLPRGKVVGLSKI